MKIINFYQYCPSRKKTSDTRIFELVKWNFALDPLEKIHWNHFSHPPWKILTTPMYTSINRNNVDASLGRYPLFVEVERVELFTNNSVRLFHILMSGCFLSLCQEWSGSCQVCGTGTQISGSDSTIQTFSTPAPQPWLLLRCYGRLPFYATLCIRDVVAFGESAISSFRSPAADFVRSRFFIINNFSNSLNQLTSNYFCVEAIGLSTLSDVEEDVDFTLICCLSFTFREIWSDR